MDNINLLYESGRVFTPSAPVATKDLFSGRFDQIRTTLNSINQAGQHVVIYGERGVGKTSLANVVQAFMPENTMNIVTVKVNCDAGTTFTGLFRSVLADITLTQTRLQAGFNAAVETSTQTLMHMIPPEEEINPNSLRLIFRQIGAKVIIIIDEFDRVEDDDTKRLLADTIKNFSDYNLDVTFILVGVADSVDKLIAEHQSVERALVQIKMPRMVVAELAGIIEKGTEKLGMAIDEGAKTRVINLSQGLPHYTHLLALYAHQSAIGDSRTNVTLADVEVAVNEAIEKTQQSIKDTYYSAVNSPRGNLFQQVLLACAMADNDELGYFTPTDLKSPLKLITGKDYEVSAFVRHLSAFCNPARGPVLHQTGYPRRYRYRFVNPLMEPFVIMHGLSKGQIDNTMV